MNGAGPRGAFSGRSAPRAGFLRERIALMKILLRIVGVLVVLVVAFLLFGFLLPRQIDVERTIAVDAPPEAVSRLVVDLERWPDWQAWNKEMDPTVTYTFSDPAVGEGAWYEWKGDKLDTGKVAITGVVPDREVAYTVDFAGQGPNPGTMTFEEVGKTAKTNVIWSFHCDMGFNPIGRYFGLMVGPMLEGDFDTGLANLKRLAETEGPGVQLETGEGAAEDVTEPEPATPDAAPSEAGDGEGTPEPESSAAESPAADASATVPSVGENAPAAPDVASPPATDGENGAAAPDSTTAPNASPEEGSP